MYTRVCLCTFIFMCIDIFQEHLDATGHITSIQIGPQNDEIVHRGLAEEHADANSRSNKELDFTRGIPYKDTNVHG